MSIVAAEISLMQIKDAAKPASESQRDKDDWKNDVRITADLDEGLLEFRKMLARKKLEERGLNAVEILRED